MAAEFLNKVFRRHDVEDALIWRDANYSYFWLLERVSVWRNDINRRGIRSGTVAVVQGDLSPNSVALLIALLQHDCIVIPIGASASADRQLVNLSEAELVFEINNVDAATVSYTGCKASHSLFCELRMRSHAGLVLFTSGSSGKVKAVVHDAVRLLAKFETPTRTLRILSFLLYDHIGGINTLFRVLSNGGCLVTVGERTPDSVLKAIEKYKVELLRHLRVFLISF